MDNDKKTISVAYRPQPGDSDTTEAYGRHFKAGEFVDLPLEFADRARANPAFEVQGEKTYGDKEDEQTNEQEEEHELSFDEAVALQNEQEYGTDDPELAERLRVARQHGRDSIGVSRIEAETAIARKRGRPRKTDTPPVDNEAAARAAQVEEDQAEIERQQEAEREDEDQRRARLDAARAEQANK